MFGATSNFAVVIPRGPVYGYDAVGLPRLVFVGIANQDGSPFLLRTPVHP
jgi:hypothetical protein